MANVVLIGFHDQGNLGIGYLASSLEARGHQVEIVDFRVGNRQILSDIRRVHPVLVGFSLIFQYAIDEFAELAAFLRRNGVDAHFTIGGHYPSLRYADVLERLPALDSIVRFEGEETLCELVEHLVRGADWRVTAGIAHRDGDAHAVSNALRPLVEDLDKLPPPCRPLEPEHVLGRRALPLLAGRGCARDCAFCSIREFYGIPPGRVVRRRAPAAVVAEMKALYEERGVTIFLFQDDDFPVVGRAGRRWSGEFVDELARQDLVGRILWKISCRADEIEAGLFRGLREAGLYLVYLGLESGTDEGLKTLNKKLRVDDSLRAVDILEEVGLLLEFGFMLFDPASTFESVRANIDFLRRIVGDGRAAAVFCKMLPYGGTPIDAQLREEGRLRGDVACPDYDFLDPRLDRCHRALMQAVHPWLQGPNALSPQLNWAWNELAVIERLFPETDGLDRYKAFLRETTRRSNEALCDTVVEQTHRFEAGRSAVGGGDIFCRRMGMAFLRERNAFVGRNRRILLDTLAEDGWAASA